MKTVKIFIFSLLGVLTLCAVTVIMPNPLGAKIKEQARARGYLEYSPLQAKRLAEVRCSQCHGLERIAKYCRRCGPPFAVVITNMKRWMKQSKKRHPEKHIQALTKPQQVVVVQAWNAMIGNWEKDFRRKDLVRMIGKQNKHIIALVDTPVAKRRIEQGLLHDGVKLKGSYEDKTKGLGKAKG